MAKIESENIRLSVSEILGVFVNTFTADDMYSLRNRKNLPQPIIKETNFFSQFSAAYLKFKSDVEHYEMKDEAHRLRIFEIRDRKRCG